MRTALSRLLLVGFLIVAVVAVIRLSSGEGSGLVDFERIDAESVRHQSFQLSAPGRFAVHAVGSFEERTTPASDTTLAAYGWIVRRGDGAVVWQMRSARPDRGTLVNVRDTVTLAPGTYDAYFASHGDPLVREPGPRDESLGERIRSFLSRGGMAWVGDAGRWRFGVQPLDEGARAATEADVRDPAEAARAVPDPLVVWQALGVRNHQRREEIIDVETPARVALRAVTEITDGVVADAAYLVRLGDRDTVWQARGEGSAWAGGSLKNRVVQDTITLQPGLYRVAFEADRSHAYYSWTANPPLRPWTWGLRMRRADTTGVIEVLDTSELDRPLLTSFECAGSRADLRAEFDLAETTDIILIAVGEAVGGSEYDYAELERRDGGGWDEIWEMDDAELTPAGGHEDNKRAVAALTLAPGTYRVRYRTDGNHDCGDGFNRAGPTEPLWGVRVFLADAGADPSAIPVRDVSPSGPPAPPPSPVADRGDLAAEVDGVGDDEDRRVTFSVAADQRVFVLAHTELTPNRPADYATIERPDGSVVWETTWENTVPGGGEYYFRRFDGEVALPPGDYVLHYRTDGSRHGEDFGPAGRALWGARVYLSGPPTEDPPASSPPASVPAPVDPTESFETV